MDKDKHIDQWDRSESPRINLHTHNKLIFYKGYNTIQWEIIVFSRNE